MAVQKPRTAPKRKTTVRVAKKKQGVTKKQGLFAATLLAVLGLIVVFATRAATAPNKIYILTRNTSDTGMATMNRMASDASVKNVYTLVDTWAIDLARDKTIYSGSAGRNEFVVHKANDGTKINSVLCAIGENCTTSKKVWMPGSKRFAYYRYPAGVGAGIEAINSDGTNYKNLVPASRQQYSNCLSINKAGTKLLFTQHTVPDTGFSTATIFTMNLDGTGRKAVTSLSGSSAERIYGCPSWSPDGSKIAFGRLKGKDAGGIPYSADIRMINANGTGLATIKTVSTNKAAEDWASLGDMMAWSPGGTSLVYMASISNVENVYQINVNTKKTVAMTSNKSTSTAIGKFGWSSDGRIVYTYGQKTDSSYNTSYSNVKTVKADGTSVKLLYQATGSTYVSDVDF